LAFIEVPRIEADKEEIFAYEANQYLRKTLVTGKEITFEVVYETEKSKGVVPMIGNDNVIVKLLEMGYAVLKENQKNIPEIYKEAVELAKREQKGIYNPAAAKLVTKKPENAKLTDKEINFLMSKNKCVEGHITKVKTPTQFIIETDSRKYFSVTLYGVNSGVQFKGEGEMQLDKYAEQAIKFNNKNFYQRDVKVEVIEQTNRVYGIVRIKKTDIAQELLKNGFFG